MERRSLLKRAGAAVTTGVVGLGAFHGATEYAPPDDPPSGTTTTGPRRTADETTTRDATEETREEGGDPPEVRHGDEFGTVVDVVEAGGDPSGNEDVTPVIERHAGDDTLLSFPPGTYRVEPFALAAYDSLGIAAATAERPTFVAAPGVCLGAPYLRFEAVSEFLLEGIDFDFTDPGAGGGVRIVADGDATVANVDLAGSCDQQVAAFRIDVVDPAGSGLVENLQATHVTDSKLTGLFVGKPHAGEVTFRNCRARGFSDNGLYASVMGLDDGANGAVHTCGGSFRDNNISNVRLGSTGSTARGVTVAVDSVPPGETVNARGIRLRNRRGQVVEDCEVRFGANAPESFGAIVFHGDNAGGTVRNTTVEVDRDGVPAVHAFAPNQPDNDPPTFRNVTVSENARGWYAATLYRRDGATFEDCVVDQRGNGRGGIRLKNASGCEIRGCRIETDRTPVVARNATVRVRDTTVVTPRGERRIGDSAFQDEVIRPP